MTRDEQEDLKREKKLAEQRTSDYGIDKEGLSVCCGSPLYPDTDICSKCKEHC